MRKLLGVIISACVITASAVPAFSQDKAALRNRMGESVMGTPGFAFPPDRADLDKALDSHNYTALSLQEKSLKTENDVLLWMNWLRFRLTTGGGYLVAKMYTLALWNLGTSMERVGRPEASSLKTSALGQAFYALSLTIVDAAQCEDTTAPTNRQNETLAQMRPIFAFGQTQTVLALLALDAATRNEKLIAPVRENDDALCRGGMAEMHAAMTAMGKSGKTPEARTVPGIYGKVIDVQAPNSYQPKFLAESVWHPRREEARKSLNEMLIRLVTPPENPAGSAPSP